MSEPETYCGGEPATNDDGICSACGQGIKGRQVSINPPIVQLTGNDLGTFLSVMSLHSRPVTSIRFTIDDGLKYKINEGMWTLPMGEVKP